MKDGKDYSVALFSSVSHVLKAEKILKKSAILYKIIPVPKSISADCGVCIRFHKDQRDTIMDALKSGCAPVEIRELLL